MKSIRTGGSLTWVWLVAVSFGLAACGGASDGARPTGPVQKVAWNDSEGEASAEAEPAEEDAPKETTVEKKAAPDPEEDEAAGDNAIDLDALPAKAEAKAAPRPKPAPAPAPELTAAAEEEEAEEEAEEEPAAKAEPEPEAPSSDPLAAELRKRRAQAKARSEAKRGKASSRKKKKAKPAADDEGSVASYKGSDPCRASKFNVPRVRDACASGGRAAAKRVMKDAIGKATATGQPLKCSDCHSNQRDYALKDDAVAELKRWLDSSSS